MSRLESMRIVDPVLSTIAQGYKNAAFIGEKLFPVVEVAKEAVRVPTFGKEAFMLYNSLRAPRSATKRIDWSVGSTRVVLEEHSLESAVDDREVEDAADGIKPFIRAVNVVMRILRLEAEVLAAQKATDPNTYPTNNKITLSGTAQWSDYDNSDPIANIESAKQAIADAIGIFPNVLVLGGPVYAALKHHPKIIDRIKYSQTGVATPDLLAKLFDLDQVLVGDAVYSDSQGNFTKVWGKHAILAYVPAPQEAAQEVPAFGYTLRKQGRPVVTKYRDENAHSTITQVSDIYAIAVLGAGAGYLIQNAVA